MSTEKKSTTSIESKSKNSRPPPGYVLVQSERSLLPQSVSGSAAASQPSIGLDLLAKQADVLRRFREWRASKGSASPSPPPSADDQKLIFDVLSASETPSGLGTGVKCFQAVSANVAYGAAVATNPQPLNTIAAGTSYYQRLGRATRGVRATIRITGEMEITSTYANFIAPCVRTVVCWDKMPLLNQLYAEDANPVIAGLAVMTTLNGGANCITMAQPHPVTNHVRYEHLHDRIWNAPAASTVGISGPNPSTNYAQLINFREEMDIDLHGRQSVWEDDGSGNFLDGELIMWVMIDANVNAIRGAGAYQWTVSYYFVDAV